MRIVAACAALLLCGGALAAPAPTPIARIDVGSTGFIDDGYALSDDGKAIAYLTTDGATNATLHLTEVGGSDVKVEGAPIDVASLRWLGPGRVLVVEHREGPQTAQLFTAKGAGLAKLGPFDQLALTTIDGRRAIVTYTRSTRRGVDHMLVAYAADTLKPIKRRIWHEDAEGQIKQGNGTIKPLWWSDGFTMLAALRAGEYDKARDLRRPDRFTRLDAFSAKVLEEKEVEDLAAFLRVSLIRRDAPNQPVVAHFSEDRRTLLLTDGLTDRELTLPRELRKYDPATLAFQAVDAGHLALSLTVDPVNPDAVKRQKADPDQIDLYLIDRNTRAATLVLQLLGQGRPSSWLLAGHRLLLLRKSKGFDRGGVALEVYEVGDGAAATH
jgi:hypothetical protein